MIIRKATKIVDKIINFVIIILLLVSISYGAYAIIDGVNVQNGATLSEDIKKNAPSNKFAQLPIDELRKINSDICAWLNIDDTLMDYPITQYTDNDYYLNRNYKKEFAAAGTVFLDYRNNVDFDDDYNVVYGHNMKGSVMFGGIKKYEDKEYFDAHSTGTLFTAKCNYKLNVLFYDRISAYESTVYNVTHYKNGCNENLFNFFKTHAITQGNIDKYDGSKILVLSTCTTNQNERVLLVCTLSKLDEDTNEE